MLADGAGKPAVEPAEIDQDDHVRHAGYGQLHQIQKHPSKNRQLDDDITQADGRLRRHVKGQLDPGLCHLRATSAKKNRARQRLGKSLDQFGSIEIAAGLAGYEHDVGTRHAGI